MFRLEPLPEHVPAAALQQLSATREATGTLQNTEGEVQTIRAVAVDVCIVSLVKLIQALSEHALSDLQDLMGPIAVSSDDASEEGTPPCKRHRTRSDGESGEEQILSDDEPGDGIADAALAHMHGVECEAPGSGNDEPGDGHSKPSLRLAVSLT